MRLLQTAAMAAWAFACSLLPAHQALADPAQRLDFTILCDGDPVGRNTITIDHQGPDTVVEVRTEALVKVAMIPIFRFDHEAEERWHGDRLDYLAATSDDDGTRHTLLAKAGTDGLKIETDGHIRNAPADILPGSLWNIRVTQGGTVLNPVDGKLLAVTVKDLGTDRIKVQGVDTVTRHFKLVSDTLEREVWFTDAGMLARVKFRRMGADIVYELR